MEAQRLIDRELAGHRPPSPAGEQTDSAGLLRQLAQLPPGWSLLAYHLAEPRSLAWVGDRSGLELIELGPAEPIVERIERVKAGLRVYNEPSLETDLAELGELLLRPVQRKLGFNVLLAAGGALSDLPLEVLPLDGRPFDGPPLIEEHQVVHIRSVRSAARSARRAAEPLAPGRLFLAGDPDLARDSLNTIPGTRQELQALRAAFPAIEANVYVGAALTAEAFRDGAFASADLVHLASHALIDRDYPELSRLIVSGGSATEPAFLTPADLAGTPLAARLVVLSACETVGVTRFDFDNRLGFVSQLLQQSDALVIASLWPVADRITGQFMADFYRELAATGSVPDALRAAKLRQRAEGRADDRSWAAFQLFSR
jgi:CHAT domain-containing protein